MWSVLADACSRYPPDRQQALCLSFALAKAERLGRILKATGPVATSA
jgi:hypothetical protein